MKAIVFREGSQWAVESIEKPVPGPGEALLRVIQTGVCGTDEHLLHGGFIAKFPLIPGHEMVGEVVELGPGEANAVVGDNVVVDNTVLCGKCHACREGNDLFCENFGSLGCNMPGGFAEYVVVDSSKVYPIGDLDPDVAVFAEPTACAVHGVDILNLKPASDVLIFGAGPTGLILSQLLKTAGAARVTVAAPTASKLEVATALGADHTVQVDRSNPEAASAALRDIAPRGFDAVIEATGSTAVLELAVSHTKTGGTVLVYGLAGENDTAAIKPYEVFSRELTIKGSYAQVHCLGRALFALQTGRVRTEGLITSKLNLDTFDQALANLHDSEQIKTIVSSR
ncbi:zinc-dependent alcohol dehydrogenase family protein [Mycetocola saprophilus]|uniref:zinc-dependent alcohol dehydrogenase family protein n=1 Tax=Mycetocola saprophilus TaxID=76636 RepID=UPI00068B4B1D|nr:zinc-dependent alcohol dehydrogenase family protein [Mycetocola saprophilus]